MARTQPRRAASNRFASPGSPLTSDDDGEEDQEDQRAISRGPRPQRRAATAATATATATGTRQRRQARAARSTAPLRIGNIASKGQSAINRHAQTANDQEESRSDQDNSQDDAESTDPNRAGSVDSFDSGSEKDMDETADYIGPGFKRAKKARVPKSKPSRTSRVAAAGGTHPKAKKGTVSTQSKKGRKGTTAQRGAARVVANKADIEIKDDNNIFNSLRNPDVAVQAIVDDWVVSYQADPEPALVELINFIIRSCGCNSTIDEAAVMDLDNVVDTLEQVQEQFKQNPNPSYPLISRIPAFKKFKGSLAEFFERLIMTSSDSELLLTAPVTAQSSELVAEPPLINVLKEWLSSFSSSAFRSFRHTSTFIVLNIVRAIAALVAINRQSVDSVRKQRDAEKKKSRPDKARVQSLDAKWRETKEDDASLMDSIRDFIDSVYQHRYRDADPLIRTDCALELGRWIKRQPEIFMKNEYTRYLGWCLSDTSGSARLAALQGLAQVYSESAFPDPLRHFTELFKARLVQMAVCDIDLSVRIATIDVLVHIERRGLLEEEQREEVGLHIFDAEPRIRQEIARFLIGLIEEEAIDAADKTIGAAPAPRGKDAKSKDDRAKWEAEMEKLRLKVLAQKLVAYEAKLDAIEATSGPQLQQQHHNAHSFLPTAIQSSLLTERGGRISLAVQALWSFEKDHVPFCSWSMLLDLLLYDHSTTQLARDNHISGADGSSAAKRVNTAVVGYNGSQPPNEGYRLQASEETVLLEALVAIVDEYQRLAQAAAILASSADSGKDDTTPHQQKLDDMTRALIPVVPKLFAKHRTETPRVSEVLLLVPHLNINRYAGSGQSAALTHLWDEVNGQFLRHSEEVLIKRGASAIRALVRFAQTQDGSGDVTPARLVAVQESLINALREPLKGKEVASSPLDEDTIFALQVNLQRLAGLSSAVDCCESIEDTEKGQVTSGWEILREVASRGKLGIESETAIVSSCLRVITIFLLWRLQNLMASSVPSRSEEMTVLANEIVCKRTEALELMEDLVTDRTSAQQEVKTLAAARLLQIHLAFHAAEQKEKAQAQKSRQVIEDQRQEDHHLTENQHRRDLVPFLRVSVPRASQEGCVNVILAELDRQILAKQETDAAESGAGEDPDDQIEDGDEDNNGEADLQAKTHAKPNKHQKGTADHNGSSQIASCLPSQARLQQEVSLNQLTAPLISAVRFGLVDICLVAAIIGKFGKLGQMFDLLVKLLIEVVREDGVLAGDGKRAVNVVIHSLQASFEDYLINGTATAEASFISLSRSLSSALVVRGAHLAILRAIDPTSLLDLHKQGADYVAHKWKAAQDANNKAIKARAPAFWKGMSNLLISASARDAHKIKSAMEKAILDAGIEVPPTSKSWDPQRQYEKRLVTLMAKQAPLQVLARARITPQKGTKGNTQRSATKSQAGAADNIDMEEGDSEDLPSRVLPLVQSTPVRNQQTTARLALLEGSTRQQGKKRTAHDDENGQVENDSRSLSSAPLLSSSSEDEEDVQDDESLPGSRKRRRI